MTPQPSSGVPNPEEAFALEVACALQRLFEDALWDRPIPVRRFVTGTSGTWVWMTFRLTDPFAGKGASAHLRGVLVEPGRSQTDVSSDAAARVLWRTEVCRPRQRASDDGAELLNGVWWRQVAPVTGVK
ncbi:hypothetical protein [Nocardioides yefusunii]|uniref:hypothetical protein n=1 Tax=Nocardioides yefusunii TaxID=2500546 RepID=UPI000FE2D625|nr:hypothetical protein [Nocardioides yefusunii]